MNMKPVKAETKIADIIPLGAFFDASYVSSAKDAPPSYPDIPYMDINTPIKQT